ncbi:hypothetical protein [Mycolicibacterium doricum]|uniref:hypothetical protein n=1 Tax=Mycolicibacterium doricum TaxID=126673 RepID=UPI001F40EE94|nr:hypothetical protein [Mycolicibacterium doricum]
MPSPMREWLSRPVATTASERVVGIQGRRQLPVQHEESRIVGLLGLAAATAVWRQAG